jgi:FMN phosphatase YigB (HAD superfamily)
LLKRGISPSEGAMVGDKIATDIVPARKRGFTTIQYTGYIDMGPSEAEYRIDNFLELKELIKKKV